MIFAINGLDRTNVNFGLKKTNLTNQNQTSTFFKEAKDTVSFSSKYNRNNTPDEVDPWVTTYLNPSDDDNISRDWFGHIRDSQEDDTMITEDFYGHHRSSNPKHHTYDYNSPYYDEEDDDD